MNGPRTITIVSGKGGTGKTTLAASFALLGAPIVTADCDVDAANLHLVLAPEVKEKHEFFALPAARIEKEECSACGLCIEACRFDAVEVRGVDEYAVDPLLCEGCMACLEVCPEDAVKEIERPAGEWYISEARTGPMVHARLRIAQENSGKLVTEVRKAAEKIAEERGMDTVLVDGPPGMGCAVIASITGADLAVSVTEATLSGMSDLERVYDLCEHMRVPMKVIVNKADLNEDVTERIRKWAKEREVEIAGELPYDETVAKYLFEGKAIVEDPDSAMGKRIRKVWERVIEPSQNIVKEVAR